MEIGQTFSEAGFSDPMVGAEFFHMLKVSPATFGDPKELVKLQEIGRFFSGFKDATYVASKALSRNTNSNISNTDHLLSFVRLHQKRNDIKKSLADVEKEISYYE